MQTLLELLRKGEDFLRKKGIEKPRLEAQLIFAHILKMSRIELFMHEQKPLTSEETAALREALLQRAAGKPTAYILSEKYFYGRPFFVSPNVLIPRPETEELVELALQQNLAGKNILDLCCGSGCIGITLALETPLAVIDFSDISAPALEITKKNFEFLITQQEKVPKSHFIQSDLLDTIVTQRKNYYDMVISNPPYVLPEEYEKLDPEVRDHEPAIALVVHNPVAFFSTMFARSFAVLHSGGTLLIETSPNLIELQQLLLKEMGFTDVHYFADLAGKNRFLKGVKP